MPPQPPKLNRHQVKKEKETLFSFKDLKKNPTSFLSLLNENLIQHKSLTSFLKKKVAIS